MGCQSCKLHKSPSAVDSINSFALDGMLGEGGFAKVFEAHLHSQNAYKVAIKVLSKSKLKERKHVDMIMSELTLLKRLRHPSMSSLHFAFTDENCAFLACDLANTDLYALLTKTPMARLTEDQVKFITVNMVDFFSYIHPRGVIHRDVKPGNATFKQLTVGTDNTDAVLQKTFLLTRRGSSK